MAGYCQHLCSLIFGVWLILSILLSRDDVIGTLWAISPLLQAETGDRIFG